MAEEEQVEVERVHKKVPKGLIGLKTAVEEYRSLSELNKDGRFDKDVYLSMLSIVQMAELFVGKIKFDRNAYQREYMIEWRKRRAAKKR